MVIHSMYQVMHRCRKMLAVRGALSIIVQKVTLVVVYWCLRVETHPCGNVVSAVMFCLRFDRLHAIRSIEQRVHHVTCALIGTSRKLAAYDYTSSLALRTTLEYELVHTNRGIQKVRVEPATRSAVATWTVIRIILRVTNNCGVTFSNVLWRLLG